MGPGSIVVVRDAGGVVESVLVRSDAVVALLRELPGPGRGLAWREMDSAAGAGYGLRAGCAVAISDMGPAGELPCADGRRAGAVLYSSSRFFAAAEVVAAARSTPLISMAIAMPKNRPRKKRVVVCSVRVFYGWHAVGPKR